MILYLKELFAGGIERLDIDYDLDLSSFESMEGEHPFRRPVHVAGAAVNRAGVVTLRAMAVFDFTTRCDRCLAEMVEHRTLPIQNVLVTELHEDADDDLLLCTGEELNLDEVVLSNIILDLPMKHLCRENCKGLCPVCGHNLNEGDCSCARQI